MRCVILAAGKGLRLKAKGDSKPLVSLLGVPLLERVILTANKAGITEFYVVNGYNGKKVREHLEKFSRRKNINIKHITNEEWEKGNGLSVLKAKEHINENFMLLMGDHIFDARIQRELTTHNARCSVTLAVDRREPLPEDTKVLEREGKILDIGKDIKESNCIDIGIFLCSPKIFSYIEEAVEEGKFELADGIAKAAQNQDAEIFDIGQINTYIPSMREEIEPFWIDIDTKEDLIKARKLLIKNACKGRNDLLATYVNKPIENLVVRGLSHTHITPNQVTILTNIIAYTSTLLFFKGYLLFASILTFVVSFMDGVDGKLSRVKIAYSNIGKMEHAFDFLFEHSWYVALAFYLSKAYGILPILLCTSIILFDSFSHLCSVAFGKTIKSRPLADYGRIEQLFRKFDGRKNSYIIFILIGILFDAPFWSLVAISVWSLVSATFYCSRVIVHLHRTDKLTLKPHNEKENEVSIPDSQPNFPLNVLKEQEATRTKQKK